MPQAQLYQIPEKSALKVAIVHYWLVGMRGGEKVLEALCEVYPQADIYTHVLDPSSVSPALLAHRISTTFIQRLPGAVRHYQKYLPLMPIALEQLDLRDYDLVISSESGPAKGVVTAPGTLHVCYCHTPMRYVWDMYHDYARGAGRLTRLAMPIFMHYLRLWDHASSDRVDHFLANSQFVARRIQKHYRREATVLYPPVDVDAFTPEPQVEDYYLMVGQLVRYKRPDLAVRACNRLGRKLIVIGDGEELATLQALAGPTVRILGRQPFAVIREHYAKCQALLFPGEEDFGIVPVEAMASGRPVIAYGRGGALETVLPGLSGLHFHEASEEALVQAMLRFERERADYVPGVIAAHARRFSRDRFKTEFSALIDQKLAGSGIPARGLDIPSSPNTAARHYVLGR